MERLSYFDLHADTLTALLDSDGSLEKNTLHTSISGGRCFDSYAQVWAVFTKPGVGYSASWEHLRAALSHSSHYLTPQGGHTPYLSVENASMVGRDSMKGDAEYLRGCGVCLIAPVWGGENALGGAHNTSAGLTALGRDFVREAMRLGMVIDISHSSHAGASDILSAAAEAGMPAVASHSCAAALCSASRNLRDDEFTAIKRSGGIVGVSLYPPHLSGGGGASAETVADHIMHFLGLGGEATVCLGCDFDGIETTPDGIGGIRDLPVLADTLVGRGIPAASVEGIFFRNAERFFERWGLKPLSESNLRYAATTLPPSLGSLI